MAWLHGALFLFDSSTPLAHSFSRSPPAPAPALTPNHTDFPRSPSPLVAALLAPFAWLYGAPDLFDSYSAGIILIQMSIPQLRKVSSVKQLNNELAQVDFDLNR